MITKDKTAKITDFGLAGIPASSRAISEIRLNLRNELVGLSVVSIEGAMGTPTHMSPEQFVNGSACDQRSDIYSLGVVLYQLMTGGQYPFLAGLPRDDSEQEAARFCRDMHKLHSFASVPSDSSPMFPIVFKCLKKDPRERYQNFFELWEDIEGLRIKLFQRPVRIPMFSREFTSVADIVREPDLKELERKAKSFRTLGYFEEAIKVYDVIIKVRNTMPCYTLVEKGECLLELNENQKALACFEEATLCIDDDFAHKLTLNGKGKALSRLGRFQEALRVFNEAIEFADHRWELCDIWEEKGKCFCGLGLDKKGNCYININEGRHVAFDKFAILVDEMVRVEPITADAYYDKGKWLKGSEEYEKALRSFLDAVHSGMDTTEVWTNIGFCFNRLKKFEAALPDLEKAINLNPNNEKAWYEKGVSLEGLGRWLEAIHSYDVASCIDRSNKHTDHIDVLLFMDAQRRKGVCLHALHRIDDALLLFQKMIEYCPTANLWFDKAKAEEDVGRTKDALCSYQEFLKKAEGDDDISPEQIEIARRRVQELQR